MSAYSLYTEQLTHLTFKVMEEKMSRHDLIFGFCNFERIYHGLMTVYNDVEVFTVTQSGSFYKANLGSWAYTQKEDRWKSINAIMNCHEIQTISF